MGREEARERVRTQDDRMIGGQVTERERERERERRGEVNKVPDMVSRATAVSAILLYTHGGCVYTRVCVRSRLLPTPAYN